MDLDAVQDHQKRFSVGPPQTRDVDDVRVAASHAPAMSQGLPGPMTVDALLAPYATVADRLIVPQAALLQMGKGSLKQFLDQSLPQTECSSCIWLLWQNLIFTARRSSVNDKHLTATCNALCIFVKSALRRSEGRLFDKDAFKDMWLECYGVVGRAFADGKTKPALQVLEALITVLSSAPSEEVLQAVTRSNVTMVLLGDPEGRLKEAMTVLSHFLRSKIFGLSYLIQVVEDVFSVHKRNWFSHLSKCKIELPNDLRANISAFSSFTLSLFVARNSQEARTAAMKLFRLLLRASKSDLVDLPNVDVRPVVAAFISCNVTTIDDFADEVSPAFFATQQEFCKYLETFAAPMDSETISLFLAVLQVGRKKAYIGEQELTATMDRAFGTARAGSFSINGVACSLLAHANANIRIQTYKLLTWSSMTTAPMPISILECVATHLKYLHNDGDAHYRGDVLSTTKKFVMRLTRTPVPWSVEAHPHSLLAEKAHPICLLMKFLEDELSPSASYTRHIMALSTLRYFFEVDKFKNTQASSGFLCWRRFYTSTLTRSLLSLILDPFDDVREISMMVLNLLDTVGDDGELGGMVGADSRRPKSPYNQIFVEDVERLAASSCRADHADGLGRLYALDHGIAVLEYLVVRLESFLCSWYKIALPITFPLHGLLLGAMYTTKSCSVTTEIQHRLLSICRRVWSLVQEHLCVDSPEFGTDDTGSEPASGPKDSLSFAWRALRDSSLLMQAILESLSPARKLLSEVGNLCLEQLTALRHRGAFSTVARTFLLCCQRTAASKDQSTQSLTHHWYQTAIGQIDDQATRLTRRSAGLPALMACVLDPEDGSAVELAFITLASKASKSIEEMDCANEVPDQPRLPQVHALNCLKEIMTNSRFRSVTEQHVPAMLRLAAQSLSAQQWAICNCGLMLFRACATRLPRTHDQGSFVVPSEMYKADNASGPLEIAIQLLQYAKDIGDRSSSNVMNPVDSDGTKRYSTSEFRGGPEITFAALDLISRCHVGSDQADEVLHLVRWQLGSSIRAIRDHAAGLLASMIRPGHELSTISEMLSLAESCHHQNEIHGYLLSCRRILDAHISTLDLPFLSSWLRQLELSLQPLMHLTGSSFHCPSVQAALIDILNRVLETASHITTDHQGLLCPSFSIINRLGRSVKDMCTLIKPLDPDLRRALALNVALSITCVENASHEQLLGLAGMIEELALYDADTTQLVLEQLQNNRNFARTEIWLALLVIVLNQHCPEDLTAQIMTMLASCLSDGSQETSSGQQEHIWVKTTSILPSSRELFNAKLRLQAELIARRPSSPHDGAWTVSDRDRSIWVDTVEVAAHDEHDLPTRLNAAYSILTYVSSPVNGYKEYFSTKSESLKVVELVHLLLQDDEEDIRNTASQAATSLMTGPTEASIHWCRQTPFAISEALLRFMRQNYSDSSELASHSLKKALNTGQGVIAYVRHNRVAELLKKIFKSSDVLFGEESQNLYVDEVRQTETWCEMLRDADIRLLDSHVISRLEEWVAEGICEIERVLDPDKTQLVFPTGPTFKLEVLILFLRIIGIAAVLINTRKAVEASGVEIQPNRQYNNSEVEVVTTKSLQSLRRDAARFNTHVKVIEALDRALAAA